MLGVLRSVLEQFRNATKNSFFGEKDLAFLETVASLETCSLSVEFHKAKWEPMQSARKIQQLSWQKVFCIQNSGHEKKSSPYSIEELLSRRLFEVCSMHLTHWLTRQNHATTDTAVNSYSKCKCDSSTACDSNAAFHKTVQTMATSSNSPGHHTEHTTGPKEGSCHVLSFTAWPHHQIIRRKHPPEFRALQRDKTIPLNCTRCMTAELSRD